MLSIGMLLLLMHLLGFALGVGASTAKLALASVPGIQMQQVPHGQRCQGRTKREGTGGRPPGAGPVERRSRRSRAWIEAFLQKRETIDGRRHKPQFRGDDEELAALLDWLGSLTATNGAVKK